MKVDLSNVSLFKEDELGIDTKVTYCFGQNGTGKSTLTNLIKRQYGDQFDVRVFQGFNSVVSSDERLNAVVIGEENVAIQAEIDAIQNQINTLQIANTDIRAKITFTDGSDTENLAVKKQIAYNDYDNYAQELDKLAQKAAKEIKDRKNPSIATSGYTKKKFYDDIPNASALSEKERMQCIDMLMSEEKHPQDIRFPIFDTEDLLASVNEIIETKIEEKVIIPRLENSAPRQEFAKMGLKIHKKGDVCAFCGNAIADDEYDRVQKYFSADEITELQDKIDDLVSRIGRYKEAVRAISIDSNEFYPEYASEVAELGRKYADSKIDYSDFFDLLLDALDRKLKSLFVPLESVTFSKELIKMRDYAARYAFFLKENNKSDVVAKKNEAERLLRLDAVKRALDEKGYSRIKEEMERRKKIYDEAVERVVERENDIRDNNKEIETLRKKIIELQMQTSNEWVLAKNINKKIKRYVDFELDLCEDADGEGFYKIKDRETQEVRDVTKLSSGEKNIIAFLYFIEKLNDSPKLVRPKIIIFDDPMNSNDESLQGLIVHQLGSVIYKYSKTDDDKIIILTHNIGFYYDLVYFHTDEDYEKNTVIILEKENNRTSIRYVTCRRENVKASYEQFWDTLIRDYNDDQADGEALLNNMRRIVEEYTLFNGYRPNDFCKACPGFLKLLHHGSHATKDINTTSVGFDKLQLVSMLYDCFKDKDDLGHIKRYWKGIENIVTQ